MIEHSGLDEGLARNYIDDVDLEKIDLDEVDKHEVDLEAVDLQTSGFAGGRSMEVLP